MNEKNILFLNCFFLDILRVSSCKIINLLDDKIKTLLCYLIPFLFFLRNFLRFSNLLFYFANYFEHKLIADT